MPLFEYRCSKCEHLEEVLQKYDDPAPATCPACGKKKTMAREVSLTSFQLKGGGWYKDLYSSTPADSGAKDAKDAAKKGEKTSPKSDSSKDSKPKDAKPKGGGDKPSPSKPTKGKSPSKAAA